MSFSNIIRDSVRGSEIFDVRDYFLARRIVLLTDVVTPESMAELILDIMYLESEGDYREITLLINSPGGDYSSGIALFDLLKSTHSPIRTVCIGTAASMGAILFLAGDKREMLPHTRLMIHDPSVSNSTLANLKPHEIERTMSELDKVRRELVDIVSQTTGKSAKVVEKMTREDCFFNAQEALDFGLATGVAELTSWEEKTYE